MDIIIIIIFKILMQIFKITYHKYIKYFLIKYTNKNLNIYTNNYIDNLINQSKSYYYLINTKII